MIALQHAVLCENCETVSDATGETCPCCNGTGGLANLARMLSKQKLETRRRLDEIEFGDTYELSE